MLLSLLVLLREVVIVVIVVIVVVVLLLLVLVLVLVVLVVVLVLVAELLVEEDKQEGQGSRQQRPLCPCDTGSRRCGPAALLSLSSLGCSTPTVTTRWQHRRRG